MLRRRAAQRVLAPLGMLLVLSGCGAEETTEVAGGGSAQGSCTFTPAGSPSRSADVPSSEPDPLAPDRVVITTSAGAVPVLLDKAQAPCTVHSFQSLTEQSFFNRTTCHRVTTSTIFVIQCGDPSGSGTGGPGYTVPDELVAQDPRLEPCDPATGTCTYFPGYLAMANSGSPDTGGSQFFLVYAESPLPPTYTVFGRTTAAGLKVLQKIGTRGTADGSPDGPPAETVTVLNVR